MKTCMSGWFNWDMDHCSKLSEWLEAKEAVGKRHYSFKLRIEAIS